jgi:MinD-like ATPase involved in chromosome partitioning or flagellar assembly
VLAGARLLEQNRLDPSALDQLKVRLVSKGVGVEFLAGYGLAQNQEVTNWQSVQQLLDFLAQRYQVVLLDTAFGFGHDSHRVVEQVAQQNLWITQPDAVSMGRFIDAQVMVANTQSAGENLLAVNRVRSSVLGARPDWQIQQVLKDRTSMKISAMLPQDEAFDQAMLQGLPLRQVAGRSKALAALSQLAKRLA